MEALILGIAMTATAVWAIVVLRSKGEQHRLSRVPGAELLLPVGLLSLLVLGTAFIFTGAQSVW